MCHDTARYRHSRHAYPWASVLCLPFAAREACLGKLPNLMHVTSFVFLNL